jgi:hypothetical protein
MCVKLLRCGIRDYCINSNPMTLTDVIESLNYTTPIAWSGGTGTFTVGDNRYDVLVRPATTDEQETFKPFFETPPVVGNVDFSMHLPSGKTTQDLTGTAGADAMKVFSVVAQAVAEQVTIHGYDVLLCVAKQTASPTNYQNRVRAYETIVERASRKSGMRSCLLSNHSGAAIYVVYAAQYENNISAVRQHLKAYYNR